MGIHILKVYPKTEAENTFMRLLKEVDVKPKSVMCRLGSVFGTDYNEYIISDGLFKQIRDKLTQEKLEETQV